MSVAAFTFVYNESVNLPIWLRYYGSNFGSKNLYVIDRESTDGSTSNLGDVNKISIPRTAFDEFRRAEFISSFHNSLLQAYDTVIFTDTDEIIVPDLAIYSGLNDYIARTDFDYVTSIGMNVCHAIHLEDPIDWDRPLLEQRKYARFFSSQCKTLISRTPVKWLPGFHSMNHRPKIDPNLFIFHLKLMDFYAAIRRQKINRETEWAQESQGLGLHHRYDSAQFVQEGFLVTVDLLNRKLVVPFEFSEDIARFDAEVTEKNGNFYIPMGHTKFVEIPERLRSAF